MGAPGPPPLAPFDLVLHHDGRWTHEGQPLRNRKLREAFDRGVLFLPDEGDAGKYVVCLRGFRGEIIVEEAGFFVRDYDPPSGRLTLSDRSSETLEVASLRSSPIDGALLCDVKRGVVPQGLAARFFHAPHAELLHAVEQTPDGPGLRICGAIHPVPEI